MTTQHLRVEGVDISFTTAGTGPALLLLHGWPQTSYAWRSIIPALAEQFTVIAPDLPGLGASSRPEHGYDKRTIARVIDALARSLKVGRVSLVGHDWGGVVAYFYAAQFQDEVDRLAVLDVTLPTKELEALPLLRRGQYNAAWHFAFHCVPGLAEVILAGREAVCG